MSGARPVPVFFATPADFRAWLGEHHATRAELWVGFYKKATGRPSITWPEAVDEALCVGWIDGVRRSVDEHAYMIRFTPRRPGSTWSRVNVGRARALIEQGRMRAAGTKAFEARTEADTGVYSYEQGDAVGLDPAHEARFRADAAAWEFFQAQPPGYRRTAILWVSSAKQEATRLRRLETLIDDSAHRRRIGPLRRPDRPA